MDGKAALVTFLVIAAIYGVVVWAWCKDDSPIMTRTKTTAYRRAVSLWAWSVVSRRICIAIRRLARTAGGTPNIPDVPSRIPGGKLARTVGAVTGIRTAAGSTSAPNAITRRCFGKALA